MIPTRWRLQGPQSPPLPYRVLIPSVGLGDRPDRASLAPCTPQVLPARWGPPSGPPSARTGHAQKCVDAPASSCLRKTLHCATHGAHRGGDRGPLFPLALPAASQAALPPGDLPPLARLALCSPHLTPPTMWSRPRVWLRPRGHASAPNWFSEPELRPSAVLTTGSQTQLTWNGQGRTFEDTLSSLQGRLTGPPFLTARRYFYAVGSQGRKNSGERSPPWDGRHPSWLIPSSSSFKP